MFALRRSSILAVLLTGAAVWSPLAAGDCMLDFERLSDASRWVLADLPVLTPTPEVSLAVAASPARQQGRISADCSTGDVINVELRMMPGEQVSFHVVTDITRPLVLNQESNMLDSVEEWVRVSAGSISSSVEPSAVAIRVPVEVEPGAVFEAQLRYHRGEGEEGSVQVNLRLEVIEEAPLFRDDFGVDPVLGQFSFFEPVESPLDGQ